MVKIMLRLFKSLKSYMTIIKICVCSNKKIWKKNNKKTATSVEN